MGNWKLLNSCNGIGDIGVQSIVENLQKICSLEGIILEFQRYLFMEEYSF